MEFYGANDPTNSVKALKKDRVVRIRLQSHQVISKLVVNQSTDRARFNISPNTL